MKTTITTTVDAAIYAAAKKADVRMSYLIMRGWQAHAGEPQLVQRIREAEETIAKLQRANARLQEIVLEMGG